MNCAELKPYDKGCDVNYKNPVKNVSLFDDQLADKYTLLDIEGNPLPREKVTEMQKYAKSLLKNSPRMKPDRLQRKVAERFKIKFA